jgi:hypothetical protein
MKWTGLAALKEKKEMHTKFESENHKAVNHFGDL